MPEGGNLVEGFPLIMSALRQLAKTARGITWSELNINQNQKQVAQFQSVHNGKGSFDMKQKLERYTAKN